MLTYLYKKLPVFRVHHFLIWIEMHENAIIKGADGCKPQARRAGEKWDRRIVLGRMLISGCGSVSDVSGGGDECVVKRVGQ
jgi:hypothetical protein